MRNSEKGQAMLEFALVFALVILGLILPFTDIAMAIGNHDIAGRIASRAANRAAEFYANGSNSCYNEAYTSAMGNFSDEPLPAGKNFTLTIEPCPKDDPTWTPPTGEPVKATVEWDHDEIFWDAFILGHFDLSRYAEFE